MTSELNIKHKKAADHLIATLKANDYQLTIKPVGDTSYLGMHVAFTASSVGIFMPG
jgi:hypothetical protein